MPTSAPIGGYARSTVDPSTVDPSTVDPSTVDPSTVDLDRIDLSDSRWFADGPPHALFARLREQAPVHHNHTAGGSGFWSVTRAEDITRISRDAATFSSAQGGIWLARDTLAPLEAARDLLIFKDPPEHSKYRDIVRTAFLPRTVTRLDDDVRATVTRALDRVCEAGSADLVTEIAVPVPLNIIATLLGAPEEDTPRLLEWTEQLERGVSEGTDGTPTLVEMATYLAGHVAQERLSAGDSLVNALLEAEVDDHRLTDAEITIFFGNLVFAGNDTTRNAFSHGMLALIEHPEQLRLLRDEPGRIPLAVEEILRWATPLNYFARTATTDTTLRGVEIATGDRLVMWYASGSRDTDTIQDADRFDVTRLKSAHQAFGGGGPHFCLGAHLARIELTILLEETLARLPDIQRDGPIARARSTWVNSLTSMPVRFTPTARSPVRAGPATG